MHLSALWPPFPFDFLATKNGKRYLVDATVTRSKTIRPTKHILAAALDCESAILFLTPDGLFGHLEPIRDRRSIAVPVAAIRTVAALREAKN